MAWRVLSIVKKKNTNLSGPGNIKYGQFKEPAEPVKQIKPKQIKSKQKIKVKPMPEVIVEDIEPESEPEIVTRPANGPSLRLEDVLPPEELHPKANPEVESEVEPEPEPVKGADGTITDITQDELALLKTKTPEQMTPEEIGMVKYGKKCEVVNLDDII